MSLSHSEAEYTALHEAVKKVIFVVEHPVMVRVDNVGTIFMTSNIITTSCTKHMDIRYKYFNEYVEDGEVEIAFVKSTDN